jgi:hypothetical protein
MVGMSRKALFVSFSGGRTSAFMARWVQQNWADRYEKIHYLFANTGQEHEKTLEFIQRCDDEWGLGIVWLEAVIDPRKGKGIRHKVVDFNTASRKGEPFEAQIAKEGVPNKANAKCSDRLKLRPMQSYRRSLGYRNKDLDTAIGIRVDEVDRMHPRHKELGLVYPLVTDAPMSRAMIDRWWSEQPFNLEIPSHHGNCVWCWHKTTRKLLTNIRDHPEWFEFPDRMERQYGDIKSTNKKFTNGERKTFFRNGLSTKDLIAMAQKPFIAFEDDANGIYTPDLFNDPFMDEAGACSESCDIYAD